MASRDIEQPVQPRRIEIGIVEGDAMIIGGAAQVFLNIPGESTPENIPGYDIVRLARLPGRSELNVTYSAEGRVREITGDANVFHASGRVSIGKVGGNLVVVDASRGVLAEVEGDALLDTTLGAHAEFMVHALASVTLRTHGEINARFVAQTGQGEIQTRLPVMVEHGRRRNLVGVSGRGDATVTLNSKYGNITIIAADSDEREHFMNKEREEDGPRTWEGGFGRYRFRTQWDRGPGHAQFHFQGPFTQNDDPDGFGIPFSPDFGFEWEQGRGAQAYGDYEEHWDDLRSQAERTTRRAAEHARRYAKRAARHVRDTNWDAVERDVMAAVDKAMAELEEALATIRHKWNKRQAESESSSFNKGEHRSKSQHVRVEYDKAEDPFDEDSSTSSMGTSSTSRLREERDAERRAILEGLRTGAISIEEAEHRFNDLG